MWVESSQMNGLTISSLVGSSQYKAIADDTLKDEDNAAWVMGLEPHIRQEWVERITWIRFVDRLAEKELIEPGCANFQRFCAEWQCLVRDGRVRPDFEYAAMLSKIHDRWFKDQTNPVNQLSIQAWNQFLSASTRYHQPDLVVPTLKAYEAMLQALSGSCFQFLPFLPAQLGEVAYAFGTLDQFFNNLRDLQEDAAQGICYLPTEVLQRFGVDRAAILELRAGQDVNFQQMMQFWLDDYLPTLLQKTISLFSATDLHPSWSIWRDWSFHRYRRIERVFRECHFDYTLFPQIYWAEVQQDLPAQLTMLQAQPRDYSLTSLDGRHSRVRQPLSTKFSRLRRGTARGVRVLQNWLYHLSLKKAPEVDSETFYC